MKVLTVRDAFGDYPVGHMITDPAEQARVIDDGHGHQVTPTEVADSFFQADGEKPAKKA